MKTLAYFLYVSLLFLTTACATQEMRQHTVLLADMDQSIDDTTFLYAPRVIRLETTHESLISRIGRMVEWDDNLYITDDRAKQVVAFDKEGKHRFTIHRVGNGKGEYGEIIDMAVDREREQLVLLTIPYALLRFDKDGNFVSRQKLSRYYKSLAITKDFVYLENSTYTNEELAPYSITVIHNNEENEILQPLKETAPFCFINGYQLNGSSPVLFTRKFDNTIYQLDKGEITRFYTIDFSNETFPEEAKGKVYDCARLNEYTLSNGYVYLMNDISNAQEHLLFKTNLFGGIYVLSKSNNSLSKYQHVFQTEYKFPLSQYTPIGGGENAVCFISSVESLMSLKSIYDNYPKQKAKASDKMLELLEQIDADSNPVIFYYKLK